MSAPINPGARGSALGQCLEIATALLAHPTYGISAKAIADGTPWCKRTILRALAVMEGHGWAEPSSPTEERDPSRVWFPGPAIAQLADAPVGIGRAA